MAMRLAWPEETLETQRQGQATQEMVALTRQQQLAAALPIITFTLVWEMGGPLVSRLDVAATNTGCGPALDLIIDIIDTAVGAAYQLGRGGASGRPQPPFVLAPGQSVALRFTTRNDYDQVLRNAAGA